MTDSSTTLTYTDPDTFDGDPHEVAAKAADQAGRVLQLAQRAMLDADKHARNAWMTRNLRADRDANPAGWAGDSEEGAHWVTLLGIVHRLPGRVVGLGKLAARKDWPK